MCRDFVQALHHQDTDVLGYDEDSVDTVRRELIILVKEKLHSVAVSISKSEAISE